jgi:hypothetical protein
LGRLEEGWYVNGASHVSKTSENSYTVDAHRNLSPTKAHAEAQLALSQLWQLLEHPYWKRECVMYNGEVIGYDRCNENFRIGFSHSWGGILCFGTESKAREFLESYPNLIEKAKLVL